MTAHLDGQKVLSLLCSPTERVRVVSRAMQRAVAMIDQLKPLEKHASSTNWHPGGVVDLEKLMLECRLIKIMSS